MENKQQTACVCACAYVCECSGETIKISDTKRRLYRDERFRSLIANQFHIV